MSRALALRVHTLELVDFEEVSFVVSCAKAQIEIRSLYPVPVRYAIEYNGYQISSTSSSLPEAFAFVVPLLFKVSILSQY